MPYKHTSVVRSLRFRLTLWNAVVVLLIVIATLVALREGLRLGLTFEAEQVLVQDADEIALDVQQSYPDHEQIHQEMDRKAIGHAPRRMFVQLFDPQGDLLWSSVHTPDNLTLDAPSTGATLLSSPPFRVAQRRVELEGVGSGWVRVGMSFAFVEADVARFTRLSTLIGGIMLLVAPVGGYWLAGRATRPLNQIILTAANLRPSNLAQRLPVSGVGDELDQLSTTINGLLDRIAVYLQRNREFVANAAHELRSPLAAIQSSVEVTLNSDRSVAEYEELLYAIIDECARLTVLVNQLLMLAENDAREALRSGELVELDAVVRRAADMFLGVADERKIELQLDVDSPITVAGDPRRLRQVVNNLIDNSLNYSRPGDRVRVDLHRDPETHDARLTVADNGIGIPHDELPHIFERFYQVDKSRRRDKGGSGLGLSICQAIVTAHGGQIEARSEVGQGTTLIVTLPAVVAPTRDRRGVSSPVSG